MAGRHASEVATTEVAVVRSHAARPSAIPQSWWPWFAAAAGAMMAALGLLLWPKPIEPVAPTAPVPEPRQVATTTGVPVASVTAPPPPGPLPVTTGVSIAPSTHVAPAPTRAPSIATPSTAASKPSRQPAPASTTRAPATTPSPRHDGPGPHGGLLGGGGLL